VRHGLSPEATVVQRVRRIPNSALKGFRGEDAADGPLIATHYSCPQAAEQPIVEKFRRTLEANTRIAQLGTAQVRPSSSVIDYGTCLYVRGNKLLQIRIAHDVAIFAIFRIPWIPTASFIQIFCPAPTNLLHSATESTII
jgi:hypothetical protein